MTSSEIANGATYFVILVMVAGIFLIGTPHTAVQSITPVTWADRTLCRMPVAGSGPGEATLTARVISGLEGREFCQNLAGETALRDRYRDVEVRWEPSPVSAERAIAERSADIVLLRPNTPGLGKNFLDDFYSEVARYPSYNVYLIGKTQAPSSKASAIQFQTIGLLSKQESRSGYIMPIRLFHRLDLAIPDLRIRYYPGHAELRRALEAGEVDIISSYWSERDRRRYPDWRPTRIDQVSEGLHWYIARDQYEALPVRCAILNVLNRLAENRDTGYFSDLILLENAYAPCKDKPSA